MFDVCALRNDGLYGKYGARNGTQRTSDGRNACRCVRTKASVDCNCVSTSAVPFVLYDFSVVPDFLGAYMDCAPYMFCRSSQAERMLIFLCNAEFSVLIENNHFFL